jgi:DNA-binding GntR family transcriptional regulator
MSEIHEGRLSPGERLTEDSLASILGVSRTPVREALGALAQRGVLARRDRGGFVVPVPNLAGLKNAFELRRLLEPYAAQRAARRSSRWPAIRY